MRDKLRNQFVPSLVALSTDSLLACGWAVLEVTTSYGEPRLHQRAIPACCSGRRDLSLLHCPLASPLQATTPTTNSQHTCMHTHARKPRPCVGAFVASAELRNFPVGPPILFTSSDARRTDIVIVSSDSIQGFALEPSGDLGYFYVIAYGVMVVVLAIASSRPTIKQ